MRLIGLLLVYWPSTLWADPFDQSEAYTTRQDPPVWMDKMDFSLLIVNYAVFALALIALAWLVFKRPQYLQRLELFILTPFRAIFTQAKRTGGMTGEFLQVVGGLLAFVSLSVWVFFCQWLKYQGLGAVSMVGLAFAALMLVRLLKGNEKPQVI
ncbi:MAG: hypothetical protein Q9M21_04600 [Mariprofundaceae bacterium]|nr:hypothetical protein [Mariprofundaceae bacterium]